MIDAQLLDKLDHIARGCRPAHASRPFGGIKLVFAGDFFQLPPVGLGRFGQKFAFDAAAWAQAQVRVILQTSRSTLYYWGDCWPAWTAHII